MALLLIWIIVLALFAGLRAAFFLPLPLASPVLISASISRLLDPPAEAEVTNPQEDLQELIEVGQQEGLIKESEGELLQSVVEFSDKVVREVMTPRPEIDA